MAMTRYVEMLEQAKRHHAADMLLRGTYGEGEADEFRACSIGCFAHEIYPSRNGEEIHMLSNKHKLVADHYGYPEWLAYLQDTIFEGLPNGESAKWHVSLAEALAGLPDDYPWQAALHRVHVALLRVAYKTAGSAQEVVQRVIDLHERAGRGEDVSDEQWSAAWSAARSAAWSAAWFAAESAARSAAWSADWSAAESAAESAARSAAWSADWSAAESAAESAAWSAAESAARSAARSAAWFAAYQEMRDGVLVALKGQS